MDDRTIDELIRDAKELSTQLFQGMLDELHKQYEEYNIEADPFTQIKKIVDAFEQSYLDSLKPKLQLVKGEGNEED